MAIASGDHLRIVVRQTILQEPAANVFDYRIEFEGGPVTYEDVVTNFNEFINAMMVICAAETFVEGFDIYNMTNGLDLWQHTYTSAVNGDRPGETMPSFTSWGFKLIRETRATAHGSKRIGGVSETDVTQGSPTATVAPLLNTFAEVMSSPQVYEPAEPGGDHVLYPVIYGEALPARTTQGGTPLPARPAVLNDIIGASFQRVTTQNSRKVGR